MMALTINTNLSSLMVQLSLKKSTLDLNRALEQMTTGYRINSAKDDAAGYAVATKMNIDLSSYRVAQNNANLGLSLLNTAESSLDIVTTHLQRIRDLAEQAANGTYGQDSIDAIQMEIDQRTEEIKRIMQTTEYNGIQLYGDGTPVSTGDFINVVTPLTEEEAIARGYTIIKTADDLNDIRNASGKYILMNDIDLSGYNWEPIKSSNSKQISLNGNGYVIKNLTINQPGETEVGLFSTLVGSITNLGLENVNITGNNTVGAFVGYLTSGLITNCYVTGKVSGNTYVGGIIGNAPAACGVDECYSSANVNGGSYVGGLIGGGSGDALYSYFDGRVSGNSYVGGLAGSGNHFDHSYSNGRVSGNTNVGGAIGRLGVPATVTNVYWNTETTGQTIGLGAGSDNTIGVTTAELNELIKNGTLTSIAPEELKGGQVFSLQVGIDSSQNSVLKFDTTFSFNLDVNVYSTTGAISAINTIDEILKQVTQKQTEFGAVQNRLESVIDSLDVSIENTTSSLSTIKDVDIAKVSSDFIRAQILQQASATLLATANQSPSVALNLI